MSDRESKTKPPDAADQMIASVSSRERRMIRRRREGPPNLWRAVALIGVVGWSVAAPMLVGVALGLWIDRRWPSRISWTLLLLIIGLVTGCVNAWNRIKQEEEDR